MSPRYEYDPSKATASIEIFPKGDYEFSVGEPKAFIRTNQNNEVSYGVRFALTITSDQQRGKRTVQTCYLHNDGGQSMTKQFQMAVYGFKRTSQDEQKFNEAMKDADWAFDPEVGTVGEAWHKMAGAHVVCTLDVGVNKDTHEQQQRFNNWRPAVTVAAT